MLDSNWIDATSSQSLEPLDQLSAHLRDLILINLEQNSSTIFGRTINSLSELDSLALIKSQYVSGEKSGNRSSMRFALLISQDPEAENVCAILSLEFTVKPEKII